MVQITEVTEQKRRRGRVNLFLDGEFWTGMPADLALELKLTRLLGEGQFETGAHVSTQRRQEVEEEVGKRVAFDKAIQLLGYRARSEQEIRRRLREHGFNDAIVDRTIERLADYNYVDDFDFCRQLIEAQRAKGKARFAVAMELNRKGVDRETADLALDEFYPEHAEREVALEWARWRFVDSDQSRAKLSRQLASRGFGFDVITAVIEELSDGLG